MNMKFTKKGSLKRKYCLRHIVCISQRFVQTILLFGKIKLFRFLFSPVSLGFCFGSYFKLCGSGRVELDGVLTVINSQIN